MSHNLIFRSGESFAADFTGRTLFGVVAPFGKYTEVHDHAGPSRPYQERIERGAFARSIKERGHKVTLVYDHDNVSMPIGKATLLREDPEGLYAEFQVARTARGDEALQLAREGMVTGFSIRAGIKGQRRESRNQVTRTELALVDVSLTPHPVYDEGAGVAGIRSHTGDPYDELLSAELAARLLSIRLKV